MSTLADYMIPSFCQCDLCRAHWRKVTEDGGPGASALAQDVDRRFPGWVELEFSESAGTPTREKDDTPKGEKE